MDTHPPSKECPEPGIAISHQLLPGEGDQSPPAVEPGSEWMAVPTVYPVCPRGLEHLNMIDQLLVHQKVEFIGDTHCCTRNCCGNYRPFDITIKDNACMEVIHLSRNFRCSSCCFPCCLQKLEVFAPPGQLVGRVLQEWSILYPQFRIENEKGEALLKIKGPFCTFAVCGDVDFQVLSTDGTEVGKISKQWSGLLREAFTDVDHFGMTFPLGLDVQIKGTLLGALFLIDFMFYETFADEGSATPCMPGCDCVFHCFSCCTSP